MSNDSGKTVLALFAGLAAGVAVGILLAPEKGEETRTKINDAANKITKDLKGKVLEGIEKIRAKKDEYAKSTSDLADEILS